MGSWKRIKMGRYPEAFIEVWTVTVIYNLVIRLKIEKFHIYLLLIYSLAISPWELEAYSVQPFIQKLFEYMGGACMVHVS